MKCPECFGDSFVRGRYDLAQMADGHPIMFRNTPARKCKQCGYLVVSAKTLRSIDAAIVAAQSTTHIMTPVFDLAVSRRPPTRSCGVHGTDPSSDRTGFGCGGAGARGTGIPTESEALQGVSRRVAC